MGTYLTRDCGCTAITGTGQKRPDRCACGNRFQTKAEVEPPERTPIRRVSEKREAEEVAGTRPRRRGNGLSPGNGFAASNAQRAKVKGMPCVGCGREESAVLVIDPMHVWPRGKGGCDHADCVLPGCRRVGGFDTAPNDPGCHPLFDEGRLDLLERLARSEAWAVEQAHPILVHGVSPVELVRRLAGNRQELVWVDRSGGVRA